MDIHTATEQAYKNGYSDGAEKNYRLTATEANLIANIKDKKFILENKIYEEIYKAALSGRFYTTVFMILPNEVDSLVGTLINDGYKVEGSKEYYYEDRWFKDGPYVDLKISWEN